MPAHSAGKGSDYRPVDQKKYGHTYDKVFGRKCPKCGTFMEKLAGVYVCTTCTEVQEQR